MKEVLQKKVPIIETANLRLRKFRPDDANDYFKYHTSAEATKYYDWKPDSVSAALEDIKLIISDYEDMNRIQWALTLKDSDRIIGDLGLLAEGAKGEVNYMICNDYCKKGIMTEALNALISFCFLQTNIRRIQALSLPENVPSSKLLERLGFVREGLLREYGYNMISKETIDLVMWSVLKSEFKNFADYKVTDYE